MGLKTLFAGHHDSGEIPALRAKSSWRPPLPPRRIDTRITSFIKQVRGLFHKKQGTQNLTPHQRQLLASIQENKSVIIASADKNLGPVGVDTEDYIKMGLDHLLDPLTYTLLTKEQAAEDIDKLREDIFSWTISHCQSLLDDAVNFIRKHLEDSAKDPLGYFYLLIKLHKQPISGRPVCSDSGSLPHALGRWVDETSQPIVKDQVLYLKNSAALQEELERMEMPSNASLFTYDAVAMYPSINTAQCIARLSDYLSSPEISSKYGFSPKALLEALTLVMLNNRMRFALVAAGVIRSE